MKKEIISVMEIQESFVGKAVEGVWDNGSVKKEEERG